MSTELIAQAFSQSLESMSQEQAGYVDSLRPGQAVELGEAAFRLMMQQLRWRMIAGETLDTSQVREMLGISRQAIAKRVASGSLLGLPSERTTVFPSWQFDAEQARVRPEVQRILSAFKERLVRFDPFVVASWASTPQPEDLGGYTPREWLEKQLDPDRVVEAARRTAAHLAA